MKGKSLSRSIGGRLNKYVVVTRHGAGIKPGRDTYFVGVGIALVVILLVVWLISCLAGCGNGNHRGDNSTATCTDSDRDGDDVTSGDEGETSTEALPRKDIQDYRDYDSLSHKKYSWYIKRNSDHGQSGCDDQIPIEKYEGYYVDRDVDETEKVMYFTFDCGYENGYTEQILDMLKKHNAKACFFVTQTYIRDNAEIVKRMKEEGHQVGNHTVTHPSMPEISVEKQIKELRDCEEYMKEATGYDMDLYFRPPSGEYSEQLLQLASDLGYRTIFWSIAYLDYDVNKQPGASYVIDHFKKYHHNGAFVLMHNVSSSNAEALDTVLTDLETRGYRFPSLDEMFTK